LEKNYEDDGKKKYRPGDVPTNDHATFQYCGRGLVLWAEDCLEELDKKA